MNTNGCTITAVVTINALPTITGTLTACVGATTQLTGSATAHATTPWASSNTGVATVSNTGLVTGVSAGTSTITYMNTNGCTITAVVTINALPATPTASVTVQPTCVTDGTIEVTAPVGGTIQYSIGGAYQASGTFTGLTAGSYNVTAQDVSTGCISAAAVLVVDPPAGAPAAPTASVTVQPTCTTPTGTIVVTAPTGGSIEYSVDGVTYQASGTFSGLAPGSYNITAQDMSTGCISSFTTLTVNPIPANPAAPTASVTIQPTCTTTTGTIVVTAPVGGTIQYSIG
jgi:hypothetical protein